jgi:hypothetical protein
MGEATKRQQNKSAQSKAPGMTKASRHLEAALPTVPSNPQSRHSEPHSHRPYATFLSKEAALLPAAVAGDIGIILKSTR